MLFAPTKIGVDILIGLSTGLFFLIVASTFFVRIFWGVLARNTERPRPTIGKSFLVAVAGGFLVLPFFLLLDLSASKPAEKRSVRSGRVFHVADEEDRARRSGIESLRNHLLMLDRVKKDETMLPQPTRLRIRNTWMIPYASGLRYSYRPDEGDGPYLALEPEILTGKRYAILRTTFDVIELAEGETK